MTRQRIDIIPTGAANIASVTAAFERLGCDVRFATTGQQVIEAAYIVLPGVGAFGAAMRKLTTGGLVAPLKERIKGNKPTLAICLGLQLLAEASEESPNTGGCAVIKSSVKRFQNAPRIPQFGWNEVSAGPGSAFIKDGYAYYANSYYLPSAPGDWTVSYSTYGDSFVAAAECGKTLACQFHPELSGSWGRTVLERWLQKGSTA